LNKGVIVIRIEYKKIKELKSIIQRRYDVVIKDNVDNDKIEVFVRGIDKPWIKIFLVNNLVTHIKNQYPLNLRIYMTWNIVCQHYQEYFGSGLPKHLKQDYYLFIDQLKNSFITYKGELRGHFSHERFINFDFNSNFFFYILKQSYMYHIYGDSIENTEWVEQEFQKNVRESTIDKKGRAERLKVAAKKTKIKVVTSIQYIRNPDVVAEVLERANGICEYCKKEAPFIRATDGTPYLEVHHEVPLSEDGDDTVDNAVAICPNCHRKVHFGFV
jgi:predicted restriction endonuclease